MNKNYILFVLPGWLVSFCYSIDDSVVLIKSLLYLLSLHNIEQFINLSHN